MIKPDTSTASCFRAAVRFLLSKQKRGASKNLSKKLGISPQYLSDMLSETTQAKIDMDMMDAIAAALGIDLLDLLAMGKGGLISGHFFPHASAVREHPPQTHERASMIILLASKDMHIDLSDFPESSRDPEFVEHHPEVRNYLKGGLDDAALYEIFVAKFRNAIRYYL